MTLGKIRQFGRIRIRIEIKKESLIRIGIKTLRMQNTRGYVQGTVPIGLFNQIGL
jgi:hypothetical protein